MKCIVLAGGSGDRLWPLSRKNYPRQFMNIKQNRSMFQETIARNMAFCDEFIIVTDVKYKNIVEAQLQAFQGLRYRCLLEEAGKMTAPAVAIACLDSDPEEYYLVVSTDHIIDGGDYKGAIVSARQKVEKGFLVTFGIKVGYPHSKYSYFKQEKGRIYSVKGSDAVKDMSLMDEETGYLWDTGILMIKAGDYLNALQKSVPKIYESCKQCAGKLNITDEAVIITEEMTRVIPPISIGKAITEKSDKVCVVTGDFKWNRIVDFEALDVYRKNYDIGQTIKEECSNVSVLNYSDQKLVVANGLEDVIIVNTTDATYVSRKGNTGRIKDIVSKNYDNYKRIFDEGDIYYASWGIKETLNQEPGYKVNKITIFPGKESSKHIHRKRNEQWSVVSGTATITLNEYTRDYIKSESIFVPMGTPHHIANRSTEDLVIIEVSFGELGDEYQNDTITVEAEKIQEPYKEALIKLDPAFKDYIWGGTRLSDQYCKRSDYDKIAESWELSTHKEGQSRIASGQYEGLLFSDYINSSGNGILGWKCEHYDRFPLLIKFIDARDDLSIQVHPDDEYALHQENEYGKNEMWYILDCEPGSYIYLGFNKDITKQEIRERAEKGTLAEVLNKVPVEKGQTFFVESGTVHAIGKGILICEIQQSSNVTYRLFDYGRKDKNGEQRELHLDKALEVLETSGITDVVQSDRKWKKLGYEAELLGECKYFSIVKHTVERKAVVLTDEASFISIVILEGDGIIAIGEEKHKFKAADCFFVPAGKRKIDVHGKCTFLKAQV